MHWLGSTLSLDWYNYRAYRRLHHWSDAVMTITAGDSQIMSSLVVVIVFPVLHLAQTVTMLLIAMTFFFRVCCSVFYYHPHLLNTNSPSLCYYSVILLLPLRLCFAGQFPLPGPPSGQYWQYCYQGSGSNFKKGPAATPTFLLHVHSSVQWGS